MPNLAGNKHLSVHFFFHRLRLSLLSFERKKYRFNPSEMDNKVVIPAPTQKLIRVTKEQKDFHKKKLLKNATNISEVHRKKT